MSINIFVYQNIFLKNGNGSRVFLITLCNWLLRYGLNGEIGESTWKCRWYWVDCPVDQHRHIIFHLSTLSPYFTFNLSICLYEYHLSSVCITTQFHSSCFTQSHSLILVTTQSEKLVIGVHLGIIISIHQWVQVLQFHKKYSHAHNVGISSLIATITSCSLLFVPPNGIISFNALFWK